MGSKSSLFRRALRHPDAFVASVRHHSYRVATSPIRTVGSIVIMYVFMILLVAFASNPDEMQTLVDSGPSVDGLVPLLPPLSFLLVLAGVSVVAVPIGTVARGVRRDLRSSRRRRKRRDE
ncbi:hypothetical protein D8Y22_12220 [Salinadaptatus halalkaliphilus]|uniref:Uncharacterized protein n=1 Tax=Salinadaptatus halalkaliphilus TaxID=2419781 RepID=A0A4S3TKN1_9EURY|nr:hypothetical protein [Salinadaptatus halalkaliphilus]THE64586.1 hypothetical protein D8Y22_12220 [Salinadaptatus halalkaliphilus]